MAALVRPCNVRGTSGARSHMWQGQGVVPVHYGAVVSPHFEVLLTRGGKGGYGGDDALHCAR